MSRQMGFSGSAIVVMGQWALCLPPRPPKNANNNKKHHALENCSRDEHRVTKRCVFISPAVYEEYNGALQISFARLFCAYRHLLLCKLPTLRYAQIHHLPRRVGAAALLNATTAIENQKSSVSGGYGPQQLDHVEIIAQRPVSLHLKRTSSHYLTTSGWPTKKLD